MERQVWKDLRPFERYLPQGPEGNVVWIRRPDHERPRSVCS